MVALVYNTRGTEKDNIDTSIPPQDPGCIRIVCISDTHGSVKFNVPDGDILVHAGDITRNSNMKEFSTFANWMETLPHKIKIAIAGNHDLVMDTDYFYPSQRTSVLQEKANVLHMFKEKGIIYLENTSFRLPPSLGGFLVYGSPYSPVHIGGAFMPEDLSDVWSSIPSGTDILITHTPPHGIQDTARNGKQAGCKHLLKAIKEIKPKVCIFGHIHEAFGVHEEEDTVYINACISNYRYRAVQPAVALDLPKPIVDDSCGLQ